MIIKLSNDLNLPKTALNAPFMVNDRPVGVITDITNEWITCNILDDYLGVEVNKDSIPLSLYLSSNIQCVMRFIKYNGKDIPMFYPSKNYVNYVNYNEEMKDDIINRLENDKPINEYEWMFINGLLINKKLSQDEKDIVINSKDIGYVENGKLIKEKRHTII